MATVPQANSSGNRFRLNFAVITASLLVVALIVTVVLRSMSVAATEGLDDADVTAVSRGNLTLGVTATGQVEPRRQAELAFAAPSGRVAEVLVVEGATVSAGDALIQLDSRQLVAARDAAAANLARAEADLLAVRERATPEQLAEAEALVRAAQGSLAQTQGSVGAADIAAARAAVEEARVSLAQLEAGPRDNERVRATANLAEARAELDRQRSALSTAKEQARQLVETRANAVRNAQSAYSSAYWDLEHVRANETDPRTLRSLTSAQQQDFQVTFDRAALALADAEAALAQADKDYATARQNEVSGLQSVEARVATAQADLDRLLGGADADALAAARARLARSQAELARLTGGERAGAVAAQSASLEAARARLEQLTADPSASNLARAEANVAQAQAQLAQAQIQLDDAILRAPFDGVVASINVVPGENVGAQSPLILIDVSSFLVKLTVDEVDIARVSPGQQVEVLIDALGETLPGTVLRFEPLPQTDSAVTAYRVTVEMDPVTSALKPGMTASATIITERREAVLRVPAAAVRTENGQSFVSVVVTGPAGERTVEERPVSLGISVGESVEVISGLSADDEVVLR